MRKAEMYGNLKDSQVGFLQKVHALGKFAPADVFCGSDAVGERKQARSMHGGEENRARGIFNVDFFVKVCLNVLKERGKKRGGPRGAPCWCFYT